jgi:hypothetical protein
LSPDAIFRDTGIASQDPDGSQSMQRAKPIVDAELVVMDEMDQNTSRVISPHFSSHAAGEEDMDMTGEPEQLLLNPIPWPEQQVDVEKQHSSDNNKVILHAGFSHLFQPRHCTDRVMQCDDDFSLSDNSTLSEDFCLDSISEDPDAFWGNDNAAPLSQERTVSPTQVSVGSVETPTTGEGPNMS